MEDIATFQKLYTIRETSLYILIIILFNNRFLFQYGKIAVAANTETVVTLTLSMSNATYCAMGSNNSYFGSDRYSCTPCVKKTSTSTITIGNIEDRTVTMGWLVCGF